MQMDHAEAITFRSHGPPAIWQEKLYEKSFPDILLAGPQLLCRILPAVNQIHKWQWPVRSFNKRRPVLPRRNTQYIRQIHPVLQTRNIQVEVTVMVRSHRKRIYVGLHLLCIHHYTIVVFIHLIEMRQYYSLLIWILQGIRKKLCNGGS